MQLHRHYILIALSISIPCSQIVQAQQAKPLSELWRSTVIASILEVPAKTLMAQTLFADCRRRAPQSSEFVDAAEQLWIERNRQYFGLDEYLMGQLDSALQNEGNEIQKRQFYEEMPISSAAEIEAIRIQAEGILDGIDPAQIADRCSALSSFIDTGAWDIGKDPRFGDVLEKARVERDAAK